MEGARSPAGEEVMSAEVTLMSVSADPYTLTCVAGCARALDEFGRCCGKKPLQYKIGLHAPGGRQKFCTRCDRSYHFETGRQKVNWAWGSPDGGKTFFRVRS